MDKNLHFETAELDLKKISERMQNLPHDKLMYIAGAISALSASVAATCEGAEEIQDSA